MPIPRYFETEPELSINSAVTFSRENLKSKHHSQASGTRRKWFTGLRFGLTGWPNVSLSNYRRTRLPSTIV